ncbi:MAG: phosphoenolpyruvate--protein phosphotransferase [Endomicrobium sp.]|jgi:phosphotransferase system enzyme I (PtsI)|nr:phosphoenolpyruvate--protein phosphotransferase [Endomicrobium sp.]
MPNNKKTDVVFKGVAASSGIAIGKVFLLEDDDFCLIQKEIPGNARQEELNRLDCAIEKTRSELEVTYGKINEVLGRNYAKIADVHLLILDDPSLKQDVVKFINEGVNAEFAVFKVINKIVASFENIDDEYFRERKHDIQDVGKKILSNLLGKRSRSLSNISGESIVVAHNLTPADTVTIRESMVKGFATDIGGKTSHTAIVAQGLEIPAVVGLKSISLHAVTGDVLIIDGNKGEVILNPAQETLAKYRSELALQSERRKDLEKLRYLPAQTVDGKTISLWGNIDNYNEIESVVKNGATGIGLYRTEFMYFNRTSMPSEDEHFENYSKVVRAMSPHAVIIRTIDIGGDKLAKLGLLNFGKEENPFMGLRAIRLCLKYPEIFICQLRGILRASVNGKIKLMYPMISGIEELRAANKILKKVKENLRKENVSFDENMEVGAMIEVPAAAIIMDAIAKEVNFVSIGTNDLIQYSLAVDRINENVANLYDPLHPAILRLIKKIIDEGHKAGIEVGMCGEMAGDPFYTPALVGLGLDDFSVSSAQIPKIKKVIRSVSYEDAKSAADQILTLGDRESILKVIEKIKITEI